MKNYQTFKFIKEIEYERISGSFEEKKCAEQIKNEILKRGYTPVIESFEVNAPIIETAFLNTANTSYQVTGYGMCGSTPISGITKEFKYVEDLYDVDLVDIDDKIILVNAMVGFKNYEKLVDKNVAGIIFYSGSVYDEIDKTDLEERMYREKLYSLKKIPSVCLRAIDAHKLVIENPFTITLGVVQKEETQNSQNVIVEIPGTESKEIICLTAHYDSVRFSKGSYDNATGSACLLELFNYYVDNHPKRTMRFIWCGSEERGLLGSKAYCHDHEEELKNAVLCINIDMIGVTLGHDIACCTTDIDVVHYINYLGKINGFAIKPYQGVYSSDSTPFADQGIPSVSFARISSNGGAKIHSRLDDATFLNEDFYNKTINFIETFTDQVVNSYAFPITKNMPDNMKEELDYYLQRKFRK